MNLRRERPPTLPGLEPAQDEFVGGGGEAELPAETADGSGEEIDFGSAPGFDVLEHGGAVFRRGGADDGFGCVVADGVPSDAGANSGSRLCFVKQA